MIVSAKLYGNHVVRFDQDVGKGREVEFKGGSLHNGFGSFDGSGSSGEHPALLLLVLQNKEQRGNRDGFWRFRRLRRLKLSPLPPFPTS